jgi:ribosomal-protein-alanine acetyltransferase
MNPLEGGSRLDQILHSSRTAGDSAGPGEGLLNRMPEDSRPPPQGRSGLGIREARSTDIEALTRLETECFASDRLSRRSLASLAKSPSACLLIATGEHGTIGYALILLRRGSQRARLYSIAVSPNATGLGIGSHLLSAAEDVARRRGASHLHLEVRSDNLTAIRLYERAGYRRVGERPGYYEDGATALLFGRHLPASTPQRRLRRAA